MTVFFRQDGHQQLAHCVHCYPYSASIESEVRGLHLAGLNMAPTIIVTDPLKSLEGMWNGSVSSHQRRKQGLSLILITHSSFA